MLSEIIFFQFVHNTPVYNAKELQELLCCLPSPVLSNTSYYLAGDKSAGPEAVHVFPLRLSD
jgi:hypothetical protein